jgi:hypothetical protein
LFTYTSNAWETIIYWCIDFIFCFTIFHSRLCRYSEVIVSSTVAASMPSFHEKVMNSVHWLLSESNTKTIITKIMEFLFFLYQCSYRFRHICHPCIRQYYLDDFYPTTNNSNAYYSLSITYSTCKSNTLFHN